MSTIAINPTGVTTRRQHTRPVRPVRPVTARPVTARPAVGRSGEVRLTRRGRLVIFVGSLLLALSVAFWFGAGSAATDHPESTRVVTVTEGDTLWDIAAEVAQPGRVSDMVTHIEKLNDMDSAALQAGQRLVVPTAG